MSNSYARKLNSCENFQVGEENRNHIIQEAKGIQEVERVEEASRDDDEVQQNSNKKKQGMQEPSYV